MSIHDDIDTGGVPAVSQEESVPTRRKRSRFFTGVGRFLLLLCLLAGFYLSLLPSGRALVRSVMILPGLIGAAQPSWEAPVAEPIEHVQKVISSGSGEVYLDVYEPADTAPPVPGSREGVLVIPGVGDERQDAQLINFSETMAHAGLVVMDMTTPTLMAYRLDSADKAAVIQAFTTLQNWPGVSSARAGLFGISGGGALMCLAAADPQIQKQVAFVALFGGYFDASTLLSTIGRHAQTVDGQTQPWLPVDVPVQVLANTIEPYLPINDGQLLLSAFNPGGSGSLSSGQIAQLAPGSVAAYHLLAGDQPDRVAANLAALSPDVKVLLTSLSPSHVITSITAPIYLLHDRSDQYVPFSESLDFAAALARLHHPYDFAALGIFQHVEVRADLGPLQLLGDAGNLLRLVSEVVQAGS